MNRLERVLRDYQGIALEAAPPFLDPEVLPPGADISNAPSPEAIAGLHSRACNFRFTAKDRAVSGGFCLLGRVCWAESYQLPVVIEGSTAFIGRNQSITVSWPKEYKIYRDQPDRCWYLMKVEIEALRGMWREVPIGQDVQLDPDNTLTLDAGPNGFASISLEL